MIVFGFLPLVILVVVGIVYFQRNRDVLDRAKFLRRCGFGFMAFATVFFVAFAAGEAVGDPGGLAAVGLISAWFVPLAGLIAFAWFAPRSALPVFAILTAATLAVAALAAAQSDSWRRFEDDHGPVRTIAVFVLSAALAVYGLHRTREAGWMLVTLGVMPFVLSTLGSHLALGSLAVAVTPALVAGALYLIAAHLEGNATPAAPRPPKFHLPRRMRAAPS